MSNPNPSKLLICSECGAAGTTPGARCWLCHAPQPLVAEIVEAEVVAGPPSFLADDIISTVACGFIVFVIVLLGIGMATEGPGLNVLFLFVVVPALAATLVRGASRRMEGRPLSWTQRLLTFLVSAVVTFGLLCLLCVTLIVAFFIYCSAAMSNM